MKLRQLIFIILLIFAFQVSFGQEKPTARKVDVFEMVDCCFPNFDAFYSELLASNSTGYVVIYKNKNKPLESYRYQYAVKSIFALDRKNTEIHFIQGKGENVTRTELWAVPKGAEKPTFAEETWDYSIPPFTKPFMLWEESTIDGICNFFYQKEYFSNILKSNEWLNMNVVIYANSAKQFRKTQKEVLEMLVDNNKITKNRIRFFNSPKIGFAEMEYWLVPKRRKS